MIFLIYVTFLSLFSSLEFSMIPMWKLWTGNRCQIGLIRSLTCRSCSIWILILLRSWWSNVFETLKFIYRIKLFHIFHGFNCLFSTIGAIKIWSDPPPNLNIRLILGFHFNSYSLEATYVANKTVFLCYYSFDLTFWTYPGAAASSLYHTCQCRIQKAAWLKAQN